MSVTILKTQHVSLQFNDTRSQQEHDARQLFLKGQDFPIKTGTEAGTDTTNYDLLSRFAKEFNHVIHFDRSNWVAIDRKIIKPNSLKLGSVFVVDNARVVGHSYDRGFPTVEFTHTSPGVGRIAQAAVHYPKDGRTPDQPNYDINRMYAKAIYGWMQEASIAKALSFVNGDFNMPDNRSDWSFGTGWTSLADELKAWQNTGSDFGPIDGFASFDSDRRVSAKSFTVLDDSEMFMNTDHFVCRGAWEITNL